MNLYLVWSEPLFLVLCCCSFSIPYHLCSAERNRQSAAASRERKKHHIKDLETRAARLSEEVARLQVADHERVRARVVAEERLQRENEDLKREVCCWPSPLAEAFVFSLVCPSRGAPIFK